MALWLSPVGFAAHETPLRGLMAVFLSPLLTFLPALPAHAGIHGLASGLCDHGPQPALGAAEYKVRTPKAGQGFPFRFQTRFPEPSAGEATFHRALRARGTKHNAAP